MSAVRAEGSGPGGRARREAALRRRFALGMALSVAAHAVLFAMPGLRVPLLPEAREGKGRLAAIRPPAREAREREPLQVIEYVIRPPGVASAGGGAASASPAKVDAFPAPRTARGTATPVPAPSAAAARAPAPVSFASRLNVRPAEARSALALPTLAGAAREGVPDGEDGSSAGDGTSASTAGRGSGAGGPGGSGVTVIGRGGDCITPGLAVPRTGRMGVDGRLPAGDFRPGGRGDGFRPRGRIPGSGGRFRP